MKLIEASSSDSDRLKDFTEKFEIPGRVDIRAKRHTNYFDFYRIQSDSFKTFIMESDDGKIEGTATIIYRKAYLNGEAQNIALARDLRVSNNRKALSEWAKNFLPVVENELKNNDSEFFFSVLSEVESKSYSALIRPRGGRRNLPRYYLLRKFQLIGIHGFVPGFSKPLSTIKISNAQEKDLDALSSYMNEKSVKRPLGYVYTPESLWNEIQNWPGLRLQDFLLAHDFSGNIIGCVAPWSSDSLQTLRITEYRSLAVRLRKVLTWGEHLGVTRRLAKKGEPLNYSNLTHLYADNPDIFFSLIYEAYHQTPKTHFLTYPYYKGFFQTQPPAWFICSRTPCAVYSVLPPSMNLPDYLRPHFQAPPPAIEIPLF